MEHEVIKKIIDSKDFTAGGGASSAIAGAMAAGMTAMVARLSIAKPVNFDVGTYNELACELDEIAGKLLVGAEADIQAYCGIRDAYKLPKESDEEKEIRKNAIAEAFVGAAKVPCENAKMNARVNELAKKLYRNSNANAETDLLCAINLSKMGAEGCLLNVRVNLDGIKDEDIKKKFVETIAFIQKYI